LFYWKIIINLTDNKLIPPKKQNKKKENKIKRSFTMGQTIGKDLCGCG